MEESSRDKIYMQKQMIYDAEERYDEYHWSDAKVEGEGKWEEERNIEKK